MISETVSLHEKFFLWEFIAKLLFVKKIHALDRRSKLELPVKSVHIRLLWHKKKIHFSWPFVFYANIFLCLTFVTIHFRNYNFSNYSVWRTKLAHRCLQYIFTFSCSIHRQCFFSCFDFLFSYVWIFYY